ncbi:MAG TPA: DUF1801 domain-containing protein [Agriterribacter sp.]|nr:DUF1801 domain-containing protein [Agriterribacter sp.]
MNSNAPDPEAYVNELPADRREAVTQLRNTVLKNIPKGFRETMSYGMIGYVVPHELYPAGYHCDPKLPLPFANIASQKHFIALYHMGIYAVPGLLQWFTTEYHKQNVGKLDMGKSGIRFKKPENIPYVLIGKLMKKISVKQWIRIYEENMKR